MNAAADRPAERDALRSWRWRFALWCTIALCLLPLTVGWALGAAAASSMIAEGWATAQAGVHVHVSGITIGAACWVGLACAALSLAALWSVILARALRRQPAERLRPWQLLGFRVGCMLAASGLFLFASEPKWQWGTLVPLALLAWSALAATVITRETGQWLFIPRQAR